MKLYQFNLKKSLDYKNSPHKHLGAAAHKAAQLLDISGRAFVVEMHDSYPIDKPNHAMVHFGCVMEPRKWGDQFGSLSNGTQCDSFAKFDKAIAILKKYADKKSTVEFSIVNGHVILSVYKTVKKEQK